MHRVPSSARFAALLLVLLMAIPLTAFANATSEDVDLKTGIVNTDNLRLRSEASLSGKILDKAETGEYLLLVGSMISNADGNWYEVTFKNQSGYMAAQYIEIPEDSTVTGKITGTSVRFRSGPSTSAGIITSFDKDVSITVTGKNGNWYRAAHNGSQGYVSADYVDIFVNGESTQVAAAGTADAAPSTEVEALRQNLVDYAKTFLGCKYVYGTMNGKTFDCSGLTSYVYQHFGYSLNRSAAGQLSNGTPVDKSELVKGDLVLFRDTSISTKAASHVGMYIGSGQFIHASSGRNSRAVVISNLSDAYYTRVYIAARRIVQ